MQQQPMAPTEEGEEPSPMNMGNVPVPDGPDLGAFAPTGGVPPELLAQLQNQMGLQLPAL